MSHTPLTQMPHRNPDAVKTAIGWALKTTGEQLVSMRGLPPPLEAYYKPNSGPGSFTDPNTVAVTAIDVSPRTSSVEEKKTRQLTATITPDDATDKSVTWTSDTPATATVNASGLVTAVSAGTAKIIVKSNDGGFEATCNLTVTPEVIKATSVTVAPTTASIEATKTTQLTATVLPAGTTDKSVTWTSSDATKATVSAAGLVTGVATGTATITATTKDGSGKFAACAVTVTPLIVKATGVTMAPKTASVEVSKTQQLSATVAPAGTTDKSLTWASSDESKATVSQTGLVTAVAEGTANITATTNDGSNKVDTCVVTVTAATGG